MPRFSPGTWAELILAMPKPILLGFDVDGVLAPFVDDPDSARVPSIVVSDLRKLVAADGIHVALITGRDNSTLRNVIRLPGAWRAVEHGGVVLAPGERKKKPKLDAKQKAALAAFEEWAETKLIPKGGHMEKKPTSRTAHVRPLMKRKPKRALKLLKHAEKVAKEAGLSVRRGRAVIEAELRPGNKADGLASITKRTGAKSVFFMGDDLTDLPAIRLAHSEGGVGLFVKSPERSRAPRGITGALGGIDESWALVRAMADGI